MKRNVIGPTITAVAERKDQKRMDAWQKRTLGYDHEIRPRSLFGEIKTVTKEELDAVLKPENYTGRSSQQVDEFLAECINPILEANKDILGESFEMKN